MSRLNPPQPTRIDKYDILGELGRGGMGVVYRARDSRMGRQVAIKTLTEGFNDDPSILQRFYHEAEKTGKLKHPNIVTVYDLGEQDGAPYIVMELVDGQSLESLIKEDRTPLLEKLRIVEQVCSALGYAHQNDVIHRDVKPANVIVQQDGVAKLLDFGIAREEKNNLGLTRTNAVVGTVPYMAPERLRGDPLDARSDIFAAGVMLYQTLTRQLPFQGEEGVLVIKLMSEKHPPLGTYLQEYPAALDGILDRSLAKNPDDRYATAEEMGAELFAIIDELKREHIDDMMLQIKRLSQEQQFVQARDALQQLLKLDHQHTEARRMLSEVQRHLSRKQRDDQAQRLSLQAEDLIRDREFVQAIELLDQAAQLVPDDKIVARLLEETRRKRVLQEKVERFLRKAETARLAGDFDTARAIMDEAMDVDAQDSRLLAAYAALARQVEEAAQRAKAWELIEKARAELKERRYAESIQILREIEQIDPFHPELHGLMSAANTGAQQEQRRKVLDEVEAVVARATTHEQARSALETIQAAIEKSGSDHALLRLQAQVMRQVKEFTDKRLLEDTARECRAKLDASPSEALQIVQTALAQLPGNENLLALQTSIQDRLARQSLEERRTELLKQAHQALSEGRFADAVKVLESCQAELQSHEISELLEFARTEMDSHEQSQYLAASLAEGQQLVSEGLYSEAIELLEPHATDAAIRSLLDQAQTQMKAAMEKAEAVARAAQPLLQAEGYEQVIAYLESLPRDVRANAAVQTVLQQALQGLEREREYLSFAAQSYALLSDQAPPAAWTTIAEPAGGSGVLAQMIRALGQRRTSIATRRVTAQMERIRVTMHTADVRTIDEMLNLHAPLLPHCGKETQDQWTTLTKQHTLRKTSEMKATPARKVR